MNKILNTIMLLTCLLITACGDENKPDAIAPIQFESSDYTVTVGKGNVIYFTGGGGVYEFTASNPEILGEIVIDSGSNQILYIHPSKTGESDLTIKDVKAEATVTLHLVVEDYYLSFQIFEIEGTNFNEFFELGYELRFVRDEDNTKPVKVVWWQNVNFQPMNVGDGIFNITRSDTDIFTLELSLHHKSDEEFVLYEYTMDGDGEYMSIFDSIFNFGWEKNIASLSSKSQPVKRVEMILTDKFNGCKIKCILQQ